MVAVKACLLQSLIFLPRASWSAWYLLGADRQQQTTAVRDSEPITKMADGPCPHLQSRYFLPKTSQRPRASPPK